MNAVVQSKMRYFKTELPDNFQITVNQNNGTLIEITKFLQFHSDCLDRNGVNVALVQWLNHEFIGNERAQQRLRSIKLAAETNSGHVAIADLTEMRIISLDLFHTMCVINSMGYDIHSNIDPLTKKICSFTLARLKRVRS